MSSSFSTIFLLFWVFTSSLLNGQSRAVMLPPCTECALSGQTVERPASGPPQLVFLQNPKPFDFKRMLGPEAKGRPQAKARIPEFEVTGRVVSVSPVVLEVVDSKDPNPDTSLCDFLFPVLFADAKLKGSISKLQFNQLVQASLFIGGNEDFPSQFVLSRLSFDAHAPNTHTCFNSTGLLLSYRGLVEYLSIYNDGTILYQDPVFNRFGSQKLSNDQLAAILKSFAAHGFDRLSHDAAQIDPQSLSFAEENSLMLLCSRLEAVSLPGRENTLAPLLTQLEELKTRATAQTFYLLLLKDHAQLSVVPWPFAKVPLKQIEHLQRGRIGGPGVTDEMRHAVPADFLSRLPFTFSSIGSLPDANRYNYLTDEGKLYAVTRMPCGNGRPHCDTFQDLTSYEIPDAETVAGQLPQDPKNPTAGTELVTRFGTLWPGATAVRLSEVPSEGIKLPRAEFRKHKVYFELFKAGSFGGGGVDLIEDGVLYRGVRVCQVDPQAPPAKCLHPEQHENH